VKFLKNLAGQRLPHRFVLWLCASVWLNACAIEPRYLSPPAIIPIPMNVAGNIVDTTIEVREDRIYYFSLRFSFRENDQADRARVRALTGSHETDKAGKALNPGVATPVYLKVSRLEGKQEFDVYTKEIDPILTSWGGDNFKKQIGYSELKPGLYKIRLRLIKATPEFSETPVALTIGFDKFKTNFTPQN
jgi:hypothetical protein